MGFPSANGCIYFCHPTPPNFWLCTLEPIRFVCENRRDIDINAQLNEWNVLKWQPADLNAVSFPWRNAFRFNCGQTVIRQSFTVWHEVITEEQAGSYSNPCWTRTANALFVKLLYFRAVLLLGHHVLTSSSSRETNWLLTILFYCIFYSIHIICSTPQSFLWFLMLSSLLDMTALFFCCLITSQCLYWWPHAAVILMFPFKQATSPFKQISFSIK